MVDFSKLYIMLIKINHWRPIFAYLVNTGACASTVPVEGPVSASPFFSVNMVELTSCRHHHNLDNALTLYTPVRVTVFFKCHDV